MAMVDIKNLDKLSAAQRQQFNALLEQFPHLDSKMEMSRELNTPTKLEQDKTNFIQPNSRMDEELDYTNFMSSPGDQTPAQSQPKPNQPKLKIDPNGSMFSSLEVPDPDGETETPQAKDTEAKKEQIRQHRIQSAIKAGQPPEIASFNPEGKIHPILQKLRATVGLRSVQPPVVVNIGGCRYSMRPLDRLAITSATTLALSTTTNPSIYQANLENAVIAYSIVAIDGVPLADVFSIPTLDDQSMAIPETKRSDLAAEAFYMEILRSPTELVDALSTHYQQEFPPLSLLTDGKAKFMCPVGDCLQTRIGESGEVCFCPIHGEKMAQEDRMPNPL